MKAFIETWSLEATIALAGLLGGLLSWIITRLATYKKKIKDDTVDEMAIDRVQDGKLLALSSKLSILESVVDKLKTDIDGLKQDNRIQEQKVYAHLNRVETKIDQVYNKLLESNG